MFINAKFIKFLFKSWLSKSKKRKVEKKKTGFYYIWVSVRNIENQETKP